ncbi:hypothetical protein BS47DRAFT_1202392 [Hydnum rufescens UP504]|uniref:DUF6534 domain-containing protein n=1 Tax=Hydnum rufescens UP504 TaxID=1448309 RepID=A0A9P6DTZ5_9AGAM|nr:hypothetical protein BS47DRAFT_1202392 [Hydnum rufescens UP504]
MCTTSECSFPPPDIPPFSFPFIMEEVNVTAVDILGGLFIGDLLTALCFGIMTIQTSTYYRSFPNDGRLVKLAVCFLWVLGAFQLACVTRSLYWWLVTNSHNPLALGRVTWEFTVYQINAVCASVIVQTFFSHRVYYLSGNPYIGVLVQVLVLFQFGFGATACIVVNMNLDSPELLRKYTWLIVTWLTSQAIADVVIAACMSVLLRHRRTGFQKADSVINRMVLYTICTGLITSVLSCFLLVLVAKDGFDFSIFTVLAISMPLDNAAECRGSWNCRSQCAYRGSRVQG